MVLGDEFEPPTCGFSSVSIIRWRCLGLQGVYIYAQGNEIQGNIDYTDNAHGDAV